MNSENHLVWSDELGRAIPSPAALQFDPDLSADWREHLEVVHYESSTAVLKDDPRYALVGEVPVGVVRSLGFLVHASPHQLSALGCAHASVDWPVAAVPAGRTEPPKSVRRTLKHSLGEQVSWAYGTPAISKPTGA